MSLLKRQLWLLKNKFQIQCQLYCYIHTQLKSLFYIKKKIINFFIKMIPGLILFVFWIHFYILSTWESLFYWSYFEEPLTHFDFCCFMVIIFVSWFKYISFWTSCQWLQIYKIVHNTYMLYCLLISLKTPLSV